MEKKDLYTAPAVRFLDIRYEGSFMMSATGIIDDWTQDEDEIDF